MEGRQDRTEQVLVCKYIYEKKDNFYEDKLTREREKKEKNQEWRQASLF